jgi:hypothetical protein
MQGRITKVFPDRHYGWLQQIPNGEYWFFHFDDAVKIPLVEKGVFVQFERGTNQGRVKATNLRPLTPVAVLGGAQ